MVLFFFVSSLNALEEEVQVHLLNPTLIEGVLHTDQGGVISAPGFRLQARTITYTCRNDVSFVCARGDLVLELGSSHFVGESLEYDFSKKQGIIQKGRTALPPWFFGGETIWLLPDNSYRIENAFITTSENHCPEWHISAQRVNLSQGGQLLAKNIRFNFVEIPLFWLPKINIHLDTIFDHPIRYQVRVAGHQGPKVGMLYEVMSWEDFKAFLRFDYRLTRGPGGGLETHYRSSENNMTWDSVNYVARDSSLEDPDEKMRFRFQGIYDWLYPNEKTSISLKYDKLSDKYMASDYKDKGLLLDTAGKTLALIRHQEPFWIGSFFTRVRVNGFQTVKQELPTLEGRWKPYLLGSSSIIGETDARISYLDYEYAKVVRNVNEYKSFRLTLKQGFYRHFESHYLFFTPEISGNVIFYSNSPDRSSKWVLQGMAGGVLRTSAFKDFGSFKHVLVPYSSYHFYSYPFTSPNHHYIFDIDDGLTNLHVAKVGLFQQILEKEGLFIPRRLLSWDLFTFLFAPEHSIHQVVPKIYSEVVWHPFRTIRYTWGLGVDFQNKKLDHCNLRLDWTVSKDLALSVEYRDRSAYSWRKSDPYNFFLEGFRNQKALFHSSLSDRRETFLAHLFYRFHPNCALEFSSRQGWNRKFEPKYTEFEMAFFVTLRSLWHMKLAYQHQENDKHRVAFYFSLGLNRPSMEPTCNPRLLEF